MPTHPASIDAGWVFLNLCSPCCLRMQETLLKTENLSLSTDSVDTLGKTQEGSFKPNSKGIQ